MLGPEVLGHLRPAELHATAWATHANPVFDVRPPFGDERAGPSLGLEFIQAVHGPGFSATGDQGIDDFACGRTIRPRGA